MSTGEYVERDHTLHPPALTPGYRKDVYCSDELLNDARYPKSAMKANCDNFEQPDTYVYPSNLRLLGDNGYQVILDKYLNDFMDMKQEPTPAIVDPPKPRRRKSEIVS